jgi:hypothetical protein
MTIPSALLLKPNDSSQKKTDRFGQGTQKGVYRWLVLSLIAYLLTHWAYLSTGGDSLPDRGESLNSLLRLSSHNWCYCYY